MKGRSVDQLVYEHIFCKGPRSSDPQNFHALLQRFLILEVRQEVHSFYGHLETQEAKYPGLDYTHPTHRIRLGRWPWHRRLFRAFDALGLTPSEIASLTKWEGTKWAKERFEREQGITIRDTASDCMGTWIEPEDRPEYIARIKGEEEMSSSVNSSRTASQDPDEAAALDNLDEGPMVVHNGDDSDEELESVGEALNERLRLRVALRNASGDNSMPLDEEWENWFKAAIESGDLPQVTAEIMQNSTANSRNNNIHVPLRVADIFPPRMLAAARAGQWNEIPDFLHEMIRHTLERESPSTNSSATTPGGADASSIASGPSSATSATASIESSSPAMASARTLPSVDYVRAFSRARMLPESRQDRDQRRTYSDLRLPATDSGGRVAAAAATAAAASTTTEPIRIQRTAAQPGA